MNKQAAFTDVCILYCFSKGEADAWTVVLHANLHAGLLGPYGFCFLVVNNLSTNDVYNVPDDRAVLLSSMLTCKRKCVSRYKSTTWVSLESFLYYGDRFWLLVPQHLPSSPSVFKQLVHFLWFFRVFFDCLHQNNFIWHLDSFKGVATQFPSFRQHFLCQF